MDRVSDIFESILNYQSIELDLQKRIFEYSSKNNLPLLVKLARHKDLSNEIDSLIRKVDSAEVLAAWASRSDRTLEEIKKLISEEKRGTVLEKLAANTEIGLEAIKQLSKVNSQNVMFKLLENSITPLEVKKEVVSNLAGVFKKNCYESKRRFIDILKKNPELASSVLDSKMTDNVSSLVFEASESMGLIDQLKLVKIVEELVKAECNDYQEAWAVSSKVNLLVPTLVNTESREMIKDNFPMTHKNNYIDTALKDLFYKINLYDNNVSEKLAEDARSEDKVTTTNLVNKVVSGSVKDFIDETCSLLFSNQSVEPVEVAKLLSYRRYKSEWPKVIARTDTADIFIALLIEDLNVAGELISQTKDKSKRIEMIEILLNHTRKNSVPVPSWFRKVPEMREYIDRVPLLFIDNHMLSVYPAVRKWYDSKIIDGLGDNNQKWELFSTLSEKFEGTLDELINTINSLTV